MNHIIVCTLNINMFHRPKTASDMMCIVYHVRVILITKANETHSIIVAVLLLIYNLNVFMR